jgi:hypothetical protein
MVVPVEIPKERRYVPMSSQRVITILAGALALGVLLAVGHLTASASNDPTVPANECSGNPTSVGKPNPPSGGHSPVEGGSVNVINDVADPIQAPTSLFNQNDSAPGQATGAKAAEVSAAATTGHCLDAGP